MKNLLSKPKLHLSNFLLLLVAGIVNATGIKIFLSGVNLYDSGISGLSMFLGAVTDVIPMSVFLLVLNVPFFLLGLKKQGIEFTVYSIFGICIYSGMAFVYDTLFDLSIGSPIAGTDFVLCAIFGGLLSGIGSGLTIRMGGSLDGIEVCGVLFSKKLGLTVGNFVMIFNVILYVTIGVYFGSWQIPLYSIIAYYVNSAALDFVVYGLDKTRAAMIVTSKPEEVGQKLSSTFGKGITTWKGEGFYSKAEKTLLYCVVNRFQMPKLQEIVRECDPHAFVTITEVSDVLGTSIKNGK